LGFCNRDGGKDENNSDNGKRKGNIWLRLRLHSGLRQSGSAFGAVFLAGLKPCPSGFGLLQS